MGIMTEAGALFDNHPRLRNKAILLDIIIVNPCAGANLGNAARHVGKHLAYTVERKRSKYQGSFPPTYFFLLLAMSTCGEVGSDVHALIKELAIRRVEHRSETRSNESQHLEEGAEVARLRRRLSFVSQQALSFPMRHHLSRQRVALASTRQLYSQGPVSVYAHRTEGVTGPKEQEGANGVEGGIGVRGRNGDGNGIGGRDGDVNDDGDTDEVGAETGMGTGVEANEGAQDGNGGGSGDGAGTGTGFEARGRTQDGNRDGSGDGNERSSGDGNGDEDEKGDGNEGGIGEGGREAKKHNKPPKNHKRDQPLLFRTRYHFCRQGVALTGTQKLRLQGLVPVHEHLMEGVTESEGREGTSGVGGRGGIGVGGGNRDGNGVVGGNGNGGGGERRSVRWERGWKRGRGGNGNRGGGGGPWTNIGWERGRERGRKREQ